MIRPAVIALLALVIGTDAALAQSVANYAPVTRTTGVTYASIATTGSSLPAWRNGANTDDNRSIAAPIGFTFYYMGQPSTSFSASTNGFMDLSSSGASGGGSSDYGSSNTAFTSNLAPSPLMLAPMYDNLSTQGNPGTTASLASSVKYQTTGAPGSRVLTVEWIGLETPFDTSPDLNFQVRLHEATGAIDFVYGTMTPGAPAYTYSCGINGLTMGMTPLPSELLAQQSPNTATFNNLERNTLPQVPATASQVTFTPQYAAVPAAPVSITFPSVSQSGMTVQWTDNSTNETFFTVYRSSDGVNFTPIGTVPSVSTPGAGFTYSLAQTGLSPGVTYSFRITAANEAAAPSVPLTGSQATPPPGTITAAGSGNWSSTTVNAPWPGGVVPTSADNVTIPAGRTVTIDTGATAFSLTVAGTLLYEPVTPRALTVTSNVTISAGGTFASAASGAVVAHQLTLGGTLLNNGTLDFSTNSNTAGAAITFTGPDNSQFSGSGATTDVRAVTVDKGSGQGSVLELLTSTFTVQGSNGDAAGFLTLANGMLEISSTVTLANRLFAAPAWVVPATSGLWLNDPNLTVVAQAASATMNGTLRLAQGTLNVGTGSGNSLGSGPGAVYDILAGSLVVSGRIATSNAVSWSQSGGAVTVANSGNGGSNLGSFDLSNAISSFRMTGGTITLRQASSAATPVDWRVASESLEITGGTLMLGRSTTTTRFNFRIAGAMPNVLIDNQTNNKTATIFAASPVTQAFLGTTIPFGAVLDLNGFTFQQQGAALQNDGAILGTLPGSWLVFDGVTAQTYAGNGVLTGPIERLVFDNPAGITLGVTIPTLVAGRVDLTRGTVTHAYKITLGSGGGSSSTVQIGRPFLNIAGGAFDVAPAFNIGSGGYTLVYGTEGVARTTGAEIPAGRTVANLSIDNPHAVTLSGGALAITGSLTLSQGTLVTSTSNLVTLANTAAVATGSSISYVSGPLGIEFNTSSPVTRTFPIGRDGELRPVTLAQVATGGVSRTVVAELTTTNTGGAPVSPLESLDHVHSWTLTNTANLNPGARVGIAFGSDDGVADLVSPRVAQSATLAGSYVSLGGSTTGVPAAGTVTATQDVVPGQSFFTIGFDPPTIVWDGGAGTTLWGDAANWSPDGVPGPNDDVLLAPAAPATIAVTGAFACRNLDVGANALLSVGGGAIAVSQGYTQTAGSVTFGAGSVSVTGATAIQGGTLAITGGSFTAHGAITLTGGAVSLGAPGQLVANGTFTLAGGAIDLGTGSLVLDGSFTVTSGTFTAATGTTRLAGTGTQTVGGGVTHWNLVCENGGVANPKRLAAGGAFQVAHDLTVAGTARLELTAATPTTLSVGGSFEYGGLTGGANLGSLTILLTGTGTLGGATLAPARRDSRTPLTPLSLSPIEMNLTVASGAVCTLADNVAVGAGRTLNVAGRLECAGFGIGGGGALAVASTGTLATAIDDPAGLGGVIAAAGGATYALGSTVEYDAAGDQNVSAANHPPAAALAVSGSGTKTLDGDLTLTASFGSNLAHGAVRVAGGVTLADGGHRITLAAAGPAHVLVNGTWQSDPGGALAFAGAAGSRLIAVDGTQLGDVIVNFANSSGRLLFGTPGTGTLTLRSLTLGGAAGSGAAGGTIVLSDSGVTNLTVTGDLSRVPVNPAVSGGGITGTASRAGTLTVLGNVVSTSTAAVQPLLAGPGTITLRLAGTAPQQLSFASGATLAATGTTLRIENPLGVTLGGPGLLHTVSGTLEIAAGNLDAGADTLFVPGTVAATGGWVVGALRKRVDTGSAVPAAFEIGDAGTAAPVALTFAHVTQPFDVTAATRGTEHPAVAAALLDTTRDVHRHWDLAADGPGFDRYDAAFTFVPGDLDPGAVSDSFVVRRYDGAQWWPALVLGHGATGVSATWLGAFGAFVTGQPDSFLVAAEPTAGGTITPGGVQHLAAGQDAGVTIAPDAGFASGPLVVDGVAQPAADHWTFPAVTADHVIAATFADTVAPAVTVVSPVGGETLTLGQHAALTWSATDNAAVTAVDLLLSRTGAAGPFQTIALGVPNSGSYDWVVSGAATSTAFLEVVAHDAAGHTAADLSDSAFAIGGTTAVGANALTLALAPVAPNPLRRHATFGFSLPAETRVRLDVIDVQGREIAELAHGTFAAGAYSIRWDATASRGAVPAGLYFARLDASGRRLVRRFVVTP